MTAQKDVSSAETYPCADAGAVDGTSEPSNLAQPRARKPPLVVQPALV